MKQDTLRRWVRLLLILVGVGILAYPSVSEYLSQRNSSRATASYDDAVLQMENARREELLAQAQDYNRQLAGSDPAAGSDATALTPESYWDLLNVDATGMMGYLEIPRLNTTIPIYHGTEEDVLQVGIGHLQTTSLPVGGPSTHAALSGHRGLPSRSLFTGLDQMEVGDHFYITVLGETLCYTVDQILTVLPHEMDALAITPGQDYVTLITCTPYGINSHRLLVRGGCARPITPSSGKRRRRFPSGKAHAVPALAAGGGGAGGHPAAARFCAGGEETEKREDTAA